MHIADRWSAPEWVHGEGRFVARDLEPVYLSAYEDGRLTSKTEEALESLRSCALCPRNCRGRAIVTA